MYLRRTLLDEEHYFGRRGEVIVFFPLAITLPPSITMVL